jgi:hypothetical protein
MSTIDQEFQAHPVIASAKMIKSREVGMMLLVLTPTTVTGRTFMGIYGDAGRNGGSNNSLFAIFLF